MEIEDAAGRAPGVALGLDEDILRAEAQPLGLDDPQENAIHKKGVVGGAVGGRVFGRGTL